MIFPLAWQMAGALLRERAIALVVVGSLLLAAGLTGVHTLPGAVADRRVLLELGVAIHALSVGGLAVSLALASGAGRAGQASVMLLRHAGVPVAVGLVARWLGIMAVVVPASVVIAGGTAAIAARSGVEWDAARVALAVASQAAKAGVITAAVLLLGGVFRSGLTAGVAAVAWWAAAQLRGGTAGILRGVPELSLFDRIGLGADGAGAATDLASLVGLAALYGLGYLALAAWAWSCREFD